MTDKLTQLPKHLIEVDNWLGEECLLKTINALLASGKAMIETSEKANQGPDFRTVTISRRLIIDLGE